MRGDYGTCIFYLLGLAVGIAILLLMKRAGV